MLPLFGRGAAVVCVVGLWEVVIVDAVGVFVVTVDTVVLKVVDAGSLLFNFTFWKIITFFISYRNFDYYGVLVVRNLGVFQSFRHVSHLKLMLIMFLKFRFYLEIISCEGVSKCAVVKTTISDLFLTVFHFSS